MTATDYAAHIAELAGRFNVVLDVRPDMPPEMAGAGYRVVRCRVCGQQNRIRRTGNARCGACKNPFGHQRSNLIMIASVSDETTYAIALHELGHILHPTGRVNEFEGSATMRATHEVATLRDVRLQLFEEESAWEWAKQNALEWTPTMQVAKDRAIQSYYKYASRLGLKPDGNVRRVR